MSSLLGLETCTHGCAWGLRDQWGMLLKNSWNIAMSCVRVRGALEHKRCDGSHQHARIEGQRTELTERYPVRMCTAIVKAMMFREDNVKDVLPGIFALGDDEKLPGVDDESEEPAVLKSDDVEQEIKRMTAKQRGHIDA